MATYNLTSSVPALSALRSGDILNCPYSGGVISVQLPAGVYKLECWGASGQYTISSPSSSSNAAYYAGAYASGQFSNTTTRYLYLYVGESAFGVSRAQKGCWNGGGAKYGSSDDNGMGGGATHISLSGGNVTTDTYCRQVAPSASLNTRLLVAGGGGSGRSTNSYMYAGYCPTIADTSSGYAGNMTSAASQSSGQIGGFGFGGTVTAIGDTASSGGGGWYGGGSPGDSYGGGGSSFAWCSTYASYKPNTWQLSSDTYLTNVSLIPANQTMPSYNGGTMTGNQMANGYARITILSLDDQTLTFNANGGTSTPNPITVAYGQGTTLPNAISKLSEPINFTTLFYGAGGSNVTGTGLKTANYTFAGWNTKADGSGTNYAAGSNMSFVSTQTLYATWTLSYTYSANNQINTVPTPTRASVTSNFTVTGVSNGGNADTSFTANQTIAYQFKEWNTRMDGQGTSYSSTSTATFDENTLLYAIWTPVTSFTNNTIDRLPIPTKTGGTFESWNTAADGSGGTYQPTSGVAFQGPTTLYAQWRNVPMYRAIVYKNGQWTVLKPYVYSNGAWGRYKPSLK